MWPQGFDRDHLLLDGADFLDALDVPEVAPGLWRARGLVCSTHPESMGGPILSQLSVIAERTVTGMAVRSLQATFPRAGRRVVDVDITVTVHARGRSFAFLSMVGRQGDAVLVTGDVMLHALEGEAQPVVTPTLPEVRINPWPWRAWATEPVDGGAELVVEADIDASPQLHRALVQQLGEMVPSMAVLRTGDRAGAGTANVLHQSLTLHQPGVDLRRRLAISTEMLLSADERWDARADLRDGAGRLVATLVQGGVVRA